MHSSRFFQVKPTYIASWLTFKVQNFLEAIRFPTNPYYVFSTTVLNDMLSLYDLTCYYPQAELMEVYVALPTGKIISLEEEESNTIKHVKEKFKVKKVSHLINNC